MAMERRGGDRENDAPEDRRKERAERERGDEEEEADDDAGEHRVEPDARAAATRRVLATALHRHLHSDGAECKSSTSRGTERVADFSLAPNPAYGVTRSRLITVMVGRSTTTIEAPSPSA